MAAALFFLLLDRRCFLGIRMFFEAPPRTSGNHGGRQSSSLDALNGRLLTFPDLIEYLAGWVGGNARGTGSAGTVSGTMSSQHLLSPQLPGHPLDVMLPLPEQSRDPGVMFSCAPPYPPISSAGGPSPPFTDLNKHLAFLLRVCGSSCPKRRNSIIYPEGEAVEQKKKNYDNDVFFRIRSPRPPCRLI
ncbi:hypothetical protein MUK42_24443 [Musa troglodytarum]|uniref:Uncharacterized protein n=1 Tax=Musa troglodytarum TaxID=320322 RepID=A0A9E7FHZ1_9LILI|nr:hypothetical protein MUK42_24443 [Musa troglodytarum]